MQRTPALWRSGASVFWESPVTAFGGQFRLCWCNDCSMSSQFRTDFGTLTMIGPHPFKQDKTCIAGLTCVMDTISGQHLDSSNVFLLLDTCGVASPNTGLPAVQWSEGQSAVVATSPLASTGGQFRLCWCVGELDVLMVSDPNWTAATNSANDTGYLLPFNSSVLMNTTTESPCKTASDYRVDIGGLTLLGGTAIYNDYTCISGRLCELDEVVTGLHIAKEDSIVFSPPNQRCVDMLKCRSWDSGRVSKQMQDSVIILDTCGVGKAAGPAPQLLTTNASVANHATWHLTIPAGYYKLCWCSSASSCQAAESFRVEVGSLLLLGPAGLAQDRTCVSGLTCAFGGVALYGSAEVESIAILETCGQLLDANLLAGMQASMTAVQQSGSNLWYGQLETGAALTAPGGSYRLCWCASWHGECENPSDFTVDFGRFDLVGVSPLDQDRTCFSGQTCKLADVSGHFLSQNSAVLVLDTCAEGRATLLRSWWDEPSESHANGAFVSWSVPPSSAPGGQYRLCWCPHRPCDIRDAVLDFGRLSLAGPAPLYQHRTCVSGRTCNLDSLTGTLWDGHVWALSTCGTEQAMIERFALEGRSILTDELSAVYNDVTTAAGGEYRLCWCSGHPPLNGTANASNASNLNCQFADEFVTDMGSLLVVGVSPLQQDRSCISGQPCYLPDIRGYSLSSLDVVAVHDTCGTQPATRWPAGTLEENSGRLSITWDLITSAGGQYRLCWCHGLSTIVEVNSEDDLDPWASNITYGNSTFQHFVLSCSTSESLQVDFGGLTLIGPSPLYQDHTCISGQSCRLAIQGSNEGDHLQILNTCGLGAPRQPGLPQQLEGTALGNSSVAFSLEALALGGTYRLCWCSGSADCLGLESFRLDVGSLTILGASRFVRDFTCLSGRSCDIAGVEGPATGPGIFTLLATCGTGVSAESFEARPAFASTDSNTWSFGQLSASGGQYRLCWCGLTEAEVLSSNTSNASASLLPLGCQTSEDFRVDSGNMHFIGPAQQQDRTCVSGRSCRVESLVGYGLSEDNKLLIMGTCGASVPPGFPTFDTTLAVHNNSWDTILVTAAGGFYRLCWCAEHLGLGCSSQLDFTTDVGSLMLLGPAPLEQHRTCVSGRACFMVPSHDHGLEGVGLGSDGLLAMSLSSSCGAGVDLEATGQLALAGLAPAAEAQAVSRIRHAGGSYRLCWCSAIGPCSSEHHAVQVGLLTVLGPNPLVQDRTCISGHHCVVDRIQGNDLEGSLMVLETCGVPSFIQSFFPKTLPQLEIADAAHDNVATPPVTFGGGLYRLCWCAEMIPGNSSNRSDRALASCETHDDFIVDAGYLAR